MRIFVLVVTFMFSTIAVNAQISLDIRTGANISGIENSDAKMKLGLKVGAGVDYSFCKEFSLRPMIYYTSKGTSVGENNLGFFPDKKTSLDYLQVPVFASYHINVTGNFSIDINGGPYAAYRISKSPINTLIEYHKLDAGISAGLDFVIKKFVIGIESEYGFTSLSKNVENLHNINYSFILGYKF